MRDFSCNRIRKFTNGFILSNLMFRNSLIITYPKEIPNNENQDIFKRNRYPSDFVDLFIKKFFGKRYITKNIY